MTDRQHCPPREDLVLLLYNEGESTERRHLERHVSACRSCRDELESLGLVRHALTTWEAPDLLPHVRLVADPPPARTRPWAWLLGPAFPLAAAATLVLGVAAGLANLEMSYGADGLTVRTGWAQGTNAAPQATTAEVSGSPVSASTSDPWRADLEALRAQLLDELSAPSQAAQAAVPAAKGGEAAPGNAALLARIERLISESEVRQQRNLALRVAELSRDFDIQRRADLVRIQQGLGETQAEAARTRELMDYFVRVSQQNPR